MKPWIMPLLPRCIMVKLGGNTGRLNSSRLYSVWIKHGHFADAKPCGKSMDKSRRLDIVHRFATLDHPLTTLRQGKIMRKSLTKNSTTTNTYRVIFSSRNHMKTTQEIVLFSPVFCPTIGGRFIWSVMSSHWLYYILIDLTSCRTHIKKYFARSFVLFLYRSSFSLI